MPHTITFQPMPVLIDGIDTEGRLMLADGKLVAVLVQLDGEHHGGDSGKWYLEAGFGKCTPPLGEALLWAMPEEAAQWVEERLSGRE